MEDDENMSKRFLKKLVALVIMVAMIAPVLSTNALMASNSFAIFASNIILTPNSNTTVPISIGNGVDSLVNGVVSKWLE